MEKGKLLGVEWGDESEPEERLLEKAERELDTAKKVRSFTLWTVVPLGLVTYALIITCAIKYLFWG